MRFILPFFVSMAVSFATLFVCYNYVPTEWLSPSHAPKAGATSITTINGTDSISGSRTTINNNFSSLSTNKVEISDLAATTSLPKLATLASLSSVGTITTGTWNGTTIDIAHGGTSSTTLSLNQLLLGNSTSQLKTVAGYGSSGQALVSNGTGVAPTWQSISFDQTGSYTLTGQWLFSGATTTNFQISNYLQWNGQKYTINGTAPASSTVLTANASNQLFWTVPVPSRYAAANITIGAISNAYSTSTTGITIPSGFMQASSTIQIRGAFTCTSDGGGTGNCTIYVRNGTTGSELATFAVAANAVNSSAYNIVFDMLIFPTNATLTGETYSYTLTGLIQSGTSLASSVFSSSAGTDSTALSGSVPLSMVARSDSSHVNVSITNMSIVISQ